MDTIYRNIKWGKVESRLVKFTFRVVSIAIIILLSFILTVLTYSILNLWLNNKVELKSIPEQSIKNIDDVTFEGKKDKDVYNVILAEESKNNYSISIVNNPLELKVVIPSGEYVIYEKKYLKLSLNQAYNTNSKLDLSSFSEIVSEDVKKSFKSLDKKEREKLIKIIFEEKFKVIGITELESSFRTFRVLNGTIQFFTFWSFFILCVIAFFKNFFISRESNHLYQFSEEYKDDNLKGVDKLKKDIIINYNINFAINVLNANTQIFDLIKYSPFSVLMSNAISWKLQNTDPSQIPGLISVLNENLSKKITTSYYFSNYINWAIPLIGFIGTILGIGNSMSAAGGVSSSNKITQILSRTEVTNQISVAFDTTLVALFLSLIGTFIVFTTKKREEDNLTMAEKYCLDFCSLTNSELRKVEDDKVIKSLEQRNVEINQKIRKYRNDINNYLIQQEKNKNEVGILQSHIQNTEDLKIYFENIVNQLTKELEDNNHVIKQKTKG